MRSIATEPSRRLTSDLAQPFDTLIPADPHFEDPLYPLSCRRRGPMSRDRIGGSSLFPPNRNTGVGEPSLSSSSLGTTCTPSHRHAYGRSYAVRRRRTTPIVDTTVLNHQGVRRGLCWMHYDACHIVPTSGHASDGGTTQRTNLGR